MKTRMQPIGTVWNKLPRVVRDMAAALGKQIRLEMEGAGTELDRTIIEAIKDPLVHLVRNSCGHGIEMPEARARAGKPPEGRLTLRAYHEGGQVHIEIGDDGAGIDVARVRQKAVEKGLLRPGQAGKLTDREAANLIFRPGFSTAGAATSVSGSGAGMDVVRSHIEKIGGSIDVFSRPGEGCTVKFKIPLWAESHEEARAAAERKTRTDIERQRLLLFRAGSFERLAIPLSLVSRLEEIPRTSIERAGGGLAVQYRDRILPLVPLHAVLEPGSPDGGPAVDPVQVIVFNDGRRSMGVIVDQIIDVAEEAVTVPHQAGRKGILGSAVVGKRVADFLDLDYITQTAGAEPVLMGEER